MLSGGGDRGRVNHRIVAVDDREGLAGIGEVGLDVGRLVGLAALEDGRAEVRGGDVVPGGEQGVDGGAADLPTAAGDKDALVRDAIAGQSSRTGR
jgi:hypothetical protein